MDNVIYGVSKQATDRLAVDMAHELRDYRVAALATDLNIMEKSGKALVAASLGIEYGFTDIDGKQPGWLTMEEA
jgi:hypothetical protein